MSMRGAFARVGALNPLKLLPIKTNFKYEQLPGYESNANSPYSSISLKKYRWRSPSPGGERFPFSVPKMSLQRLLALLMASILCVGLLVAGSTKYNTKPQPKPKPPPRQAYPWENFPRYVTFYKYISKSINTDNYQAEWLLQWRRLVGPQVETRRRANYLVVK
jgi:hypothetical protein